MSDTRRPSRARELLARVAENAAEPISKLGSGLSVQDKIAYAESETRQGISRWIIRLFVVVNIVTLGLILGLALDDRSQLAAGLIKPSERLVNSQVLITLLGATTVQLGTIAVIMAKFLFKAPVDPG